MAWPEHKPPAIRLSAEDWVDDGWQLEGTARFAGGGTNPGPPSSTSPAPVSVPSKTPPGSGYQIPLATVAKHALEGTRAVLDPGHLVVKFCTRPVRGFPKSVHWQLLLFSGRP